MAPDLANQFQEREMFHMQAAVIKNFTGATLTI